MHVSSTSLLSLAACLLVAQLSENLAPLNRVQESPQGPTIFRKLTLGGEFPPLALMELDGESVTLEIDPACVNVVAFLRADQIDSRRMLRDLEQLALDVELENLRIAVVGMHSREENEWETAAKALPKRVTIYLDGGEVSKSLGLIVLPSVALVSAGGSLQRSYVLHDETLLGRLRADIQLCSAGSTGEVDEKELLRRRFEQIVHNAAALEASGNLSDALKQRLSLVELGLDPARVHVDLGRTYFLQGDPNAAIGHLQLSLEKEETVTARTWLGRALARAGRGEEAERVLVEVLPLAPEKAVIHRELSLIFKERGDIDSSLDHIKAAIAALRPGPGGPDEEGH